MCSTPGFHADGGEPVLLLFFPLIRAFAFFSFKVFMNIHFQRFVSRCRKSKDLERFITVGNSKCSSTVLKKTKKGGKFQL